MTNRAILIETICNIYQHFGYVDSDISGDTIFQDPRMSHQNHENCDLCFPIISVGSSFASVPGVVIYPHHKRFKLNIDVKKMQEEFPLVSKSWPLPIKSCSASSIAFCFLLDHEKAFHNVVSKVIAEQENYGKFSCLGRNVYLTKEHVPEDQDKVNLTQLRIDLAFGSLYNLFTHLGYKVLIGGDAQSSAEIGRKFHLCHKLLSSTKDQEYTIILCGAVLDVSTGAKATNLSAKDYYRKKRTVFEEMAQGRDNYIDNQQVTYLSIAEVTAELLGVKLHDHVSVSLSDDPDTVGISRGASFLLYNHVRLTTIRKKFLSDAESGIYPKLPNIKEIDFSLLTQKEEWELLLLVLKLPSWMVTCVDTKNKVSLHTILIGLDKICRTFSVYYRRVRILTEPRAHLLPTMYARLYLLHCVEVVLSIGLSIFKMKPLDFM